MVLPLLPLLGAAAAGSYGMTKWRDAREAERGRVRDALIGSMGTSEIMHPQMGMMQPAGPGMPGHVPATGTFSADPTERARSLGALADMGGDFGKQAAALLGQQIAGPQPADMTSLQQNAIAAGYTPGTPEFQAFMERLLTQPKTSVRTNVDARTIGADPLDQVVPTEQLMKMRDPGNQMFKPGATWRDIRDGGGRLVTTGEAKSIEGKRGADQVLGVMRSLLFGPDGNSSLFPDEAKAANIIEGGQNALGDWFKTKPRVHLYESQKEAALAEFAKLRGESGTLTDQDIARVGKTWPQLYPIPDTDKIARAKMDAIQAFVDARINQGMSPEAAQAVADRILEAVMDPGYPYTTSAPLLGDSDAMPVYGDAENIDTGDGKRVIGGRTYTVIGGN